MIFKENTVVLSMKDIPRNFPQYRNHILDTYQKDSIMDSELGEDVSKYIKLNTRPTFKQIQSMDRKWRGELKDRLSVKMADDLTIDLQHQEYNLTVKVIHSFTTTNDDVLIRVSTVEFQGNKADLMRFKLKYC